jgi:Zn-finger nucleic acid-binding protein
MPKIAPPNSEVGLERRWRARSREGCSGIVLDWCREHGTWLDRGELQKIITFIKNGGLRKAREREIEDPQERRLDFKTLRLRVILK